MKYIRTKDGRIIDSNRFKIKREIYENGDLKYYEFGTTPYIDREVLYVGKTEIANQADTIEELICDDDILYIHDLYPDVVLVVEGNIKPFGYPTAIKLKEWLGYKNIKFDLFIKDSKGNYIKRAETNEKGEMELL